MKNQLLATKFHVPHQHKKNIVRQRLLKKLQYGLEENHKLLLISAPAGYGKTALVAEWINHLKFEGKSTPLAVTWLSLDKADNDPMRFLHYFLAAVQQVDGAIGAQVQSLLETPALPSFPHLFDDLLNDLAQIDTSFILVLDDCHVITNPEIWTILEYFLDHQPLSTHVVLTTRADPSLPLARWRARRQLSELRARDLRFTIDEARAYFESINLPLAENTLHALDERTEGWAVGLQLAALALQHQPDPAVFIETFHGSHRYVLDYLAEEIVLQQDKKIYSFLKQTSLLNRFNAELCSALIDQPNAQSIIEHLEQSNLFIIPLDDERNWYRYHHLFGDYLRSLLTKSEQSALYKKASLWHETNDLSAEAIRYALVCGDNVFAADVIERVLERDSTWSDGYLSELASWLDNLPPKVIQSRPRLGLHVSRLLYLQNRFVEAESQLSQSESLLQSQKRTPENDILLATAELYRGAIAAAYGNYQQTIAIIPAAQARIPREKHLTHARAFFSLGLAFETAGQITQAIDNYLQSSSEAQSAGVLFLNVQGLCATAQLQISQGRLSLAAETCDKAIKLAKGVRLPPLGLVWTILGIIALERNNLLSAEKYLQDGIALSRKGGLLDDLITGLISLSRLRAYQNDLSSMQVALNEAQSIMWTFNNVQRIASLTQSYQARLNHYTGHYKAATRWASDYRAKRAEPLHDFEELTLARILLSNHELKDIPGILLTILNKSTATGRILSSLEAMILLGLYHYAQKDIDTALGWLEKSMGLAAPENFIRVYLDAGPLLLDLYPKVRHAAPELVDAILNNSQYPAQFHLKSFEVLPDPLSEQETRILKLIVKGKSNAEIAAELVISIGTAKWHVHNILQKLGVSNRSQAIVRARELCM